MKLGKRWIWAGIAATSVAAISVIIDYNITCGWASRIPWSCMSWSNFKIFRMQFAEDLPPGKPRLAVEDYLERQGIPFAYGTATTEIEEKRMFIEKQMPSGWRNPFVGYVFWNIYFDRSDRLVRIETAQQYK
ncbi:MAG: hypothetical protein JSR47_06910 [Proteobacteria bacterium]|nr:hypothetical protein [Pseudomonadota bacterium]